MPRVLHIGASFAIVLVAYWTYSLLAVPLIEPPADPRANPQPGTPQNYLPPTSGPMQPKDLEGLFPPGSWELQEPKILENDQVKLLMQKYQNLDDGWVELTPLTMLFLPDEPVADPAQRKRQAIILEVPDGAKLRFDPPLSLSRLKIGRLVEGKLRGKVTIRSQGKLPGPEDDLLVTTRDVELSERRAWTASTVDFRWGPHYGRGRQMEIKLLPPQTPGAAHPTGPNVGGIESFELQTVERLHLDLGQLSAQRKPASSQPGGQPVAAAPGAAGKTPLGMSGGANLPIEVTCRGPFQFNLAQNLATFKDQVDVLRIHPSGPGDRLSCELLSIFFASAAKAAAPGGKKQRSGAFDLQPQRLEARGAPAIVSAPADKVSAQGERLEYDLQSGSLLLDGSHEVQLQQLTNEIHARSVRYDPAGPGRLGRMLAKGPGWLRGQMADRPGEQLEARWGEQLEVRPQEKNQVISLTGGAGLKYQATGQLDAREIHFWLLELPPLAPAGQSRLQPDRMLAQGEVRVNSPQLSSAVERLEIWFEAAVQAAAGPIARSTSARSGAPAGLATTAGPSGATHDASAGAARPQHLEILGSLLQARVRTHEQQQAELLELTVDGNVHFAETQTAAPNEQPLLVTGQRLHVSEANGPNAEATVTGAPAHFEARGLSLTGPNIHFERGANRVGMEGPGRMQAPVDRDMEGRPLPRPTVLQVEWQRSMTFDGRTAHFEDSVTASSASQRLQTRFLDVKLQQPMLFSEPKPQQPPQIEQIFCRGGVFIENRSMDGQQQTSYERMNVADLTINMLSGAITGGGPGWLVSVRRGAANQPLSPLAVVGGAPTAVAPQAAPNAATQLTCLHLRFFGALSGDIHRKEMTFREQVRAAFAPVQSWVALLDSDNPEVLGPQAVILHCDQLKVNDMSPVSGSGGGHSAELLATGNVVAEGTTFTARSLRMTYDQTKDMLILEGDGRSDAELFRQQHVGSAASKFAARKIIYWPKLRQVKVDGFKSLESNQLPGGEAKKGAKSPVPGRL